MTIQPPRWSDAVAAAERLRRVFPPSPLLRATPDLAAELLLKADTLLPSGSFKVRGIWDAVSQLSPEAVAPGLSTVSAGNTALALAWAARRRGVTARSLLPETVPTAKVEAFRAAGGEARLVPVPELFRFLKERLWEREPYAFVHPWIEPAVHRGHASLAVELLEAAPDVESVFIPVGGGGLLTGVAGALKDRRPEVRIFAVEPAGCAALHHSLEAGRAVAAPCETVCDGAAVPYLTEELYPALARPRGPDRAGAGRRDPRHLTGPPSQPENPHGTLRRAGDRRRADGAGRRARSERGHPHRRQRRRGGDPPAAGSLNAVQALRNCDTEPSASRMTPPARERWPLVGTARRRRAKLRIADPRGGARQRERRSPDRHRCPPGQRNADRPPALRPGRTARCRHRFTSVQRFPLDQMVLRWAGPC